VADFELTRDRADRRLFTLEGVGTLHLQGWWRRGASAEAEGRSWEFTRRGFWRAVVEATDAAGTPVGRFTAHGWRRGGAVQWGGRQLILRPASRWRERYALADGTGELALFDAKGWGRRPVSVSVHDAARVEPGAILFAAFVVKDLAYDASAATAGAAATTG
jgi:hypothetical protein